MLMRIICIIIARGGSKSILNKNIINLNKKPLLAWTINQVLNSKIKLDLWVSSDSERILKTAKNYGAKIIKRPLKFAKDNSSSEEAWLHAIKYIEKVRNIKLDYNDVIIAPQVTSPIRNSKDFKDALHQFIKEKADSMFTANKLNDFFIWSVENNKYKSSNYNFKKRPVRQKIKSKFHKQMF